MASAFGRAPSLTAAATMPSFPCVEKPYQFTSTGKAIIVYEPIPDFDGPDDVVMEDVEDDTDPMEFEEKDIPEEFKCCITMAIMHDPVIDINDGRSYEREAILLWVQKNGTSPLTREPLNKRDLKSNWKLREKIRAFRANNPDLDLD